MQSADINSITSVKCWEGIDLRWFNTLQDTTSMVFTKQYGFRFSSCEYRGLADKQGVRTPATQLSLCLPWLYYGCTLAMAVRAMVLY